MFDPYAEATKTIVDRRLGFSNNSGVCFSLLLCGAKIFFLMGESRSGDVKAPGDTRFSVVIGRNNAVN